MNRKAGFALWVTVVTLLLFSQNAIADIEFKDLSSSFSRIALSGEVNTWYRASNKPFFGLPFGEESSSDTEHAEIFAQFTVNFQKDLDWTKLEVEGGVAYMATIGQDFAGIFNDTSVTEALTAFVKLNRLFGKPLAVTAGKQRIEIEKSFIIGSGSISNASLYIAAYRNRTFPFAFRVDTASEHVKTNFFWARSQQYWQQFDQWTPGGVGKNGVEVAGANIHIDLAKYLFLYGGYYHKIDNSNLLLANFTPGGQSRLARNNTNAYDIGIDLNLDTIHVEGEFVYQNGKAGQLNGVDLDRDAYAGFAKLTYSPKIRYSPFFRVHFAHFSGDSNLEDDKAEDYDPMFISVIDWNKWIIGQQGGVQLANTNKTNWVFEAGFTPHKIVTLRAMYILHRLNENYVGVLNRRTALSSKNWADEVNLGAAFTFYDYFFGNIVLGYVRPNEAAQEWAGSDHDALFAQFWMQFYF